MGETDSQKPKAPANTWDLGTASWWPPAQPAADEFIDYAKIFDRERSLAQFDAVSGAAKQYVVGSAIGAAFRDSIRAKIESGSPASYIRLGDADGNVLFGLMGIYPELAEYCLRKISKIYFGNERLMVDERDFFGKTILQALEVADGIGGPERGTVESSFATPFPKLDVRGMCGMRGVYNHLAENYELAKLGNAMWSSTWFSRSLLPHYFDLLQNLDYVGFITCYEELPELVKAKANIGRVELIHVPMQASIAYQTKRAPHMAKDIGHYPGAFPRIMDAIRPPRPGAVYIVAAGILSKIYCTTIKERGGIGIDIGSIADVWMNTRSRPDMDNRIVENWSLKGSSNDP